MENSPTFFNMSGKIVLSRRAGTQILEKGKTNWYRTSGTQNAKTKVRDAGTRGPGNVGTRDAKALQSTGTRAHSWLLDKIYPLSPITKYNKKS